MYQPPLQEMCLDVWAEGAGVWLGPEPRAGVLQPLPATSSLLDLYFSWHNPGKPEASSM